MVTPYADIEQMMAWKQEADGLPSLKRRADHVRRRLQEVTRQIEEQAAVLANEQADVDRLQNKSLGNYILSLSRKMDERQRKEEAELVAAEHRYADLVAEAQYLRQTLAGHEKQLQQAGQAETAWANGIRARKNWLGNQEDSAEAARYRELQQTQAAAQQQVIEIGEALTVARQAGSTAEAMLDRLNSAEGWSTFDVWSKGGIITHAAKYNHLDRVSELSGRLKAQLRDLRTELADIRMDASLSLHDYDGGTRAMDFWFDNIFTDLSIRNRVREDTSETHRVRGKLRQLEKDLERRQAGAKGEVRQAAAALQQLLLALDRQQG